MANRFINFRSNPALSFFDSKKVISAVDKAARRVLSRFGAIVMGRARRSVRRSKKSADPGQPARAHSPGRTGLKRIFFVYDLARQSVLIGPVRNNSPSLTGSAQTVPELMEEGGTVIRRVNGKLKRVQYHKHPIMTPVFNQAHPELPRMFKNQVR